MFWELANLRCFSLMLISMYLLSSTLTMNFCMRISSPVHVHRYKIYFNEHKGKIRTIGCIRGCGDNSLITCSRLEMFTLNIWDVIQLALCAIFVLNVFLVKKKKFVLYIFSFVCICSYEEQFLQENALSPALIWMMWKGVLVIRN